jgi:hypothetical protein
VCLNEQVGVSSIGSSNAVGQKKVITVNASRDIMNFMGLASLREKIWYGMCYIVDRQESEML